MRSLGVLCARGSSKRLPRKHLRPLLGLPLVAWMCRAAAASNLTRVVMTTEDREIAAVAQENGAGVPFLRSAHLAEDFAADFEIVADALDRVEAEEGLTYDIVVMLQPTTPFTLPEHIDGCVARLDSNAAIAACFTAKPVSEPAQWMFSVDENTDLAVPLFEGFGLNATAHKQLLQRSWFPSGAAYAVRTGALRDQKCIYATPYAIQPMSRERSVDIDEEIDLLVADAVARATQIAPVPMNAFVRTKEGQKVP
jgi:CMP-N-acetylneuraminic acid synthetase